MKTYQDGKLIMFAWLSRGMVSEEDMATWRFGGSVDALREHMKQTRNNMRHLYHFDNLEDENYEQEAKKADLALQTSLKGETKTTWAIMDEEQEPPQPIMLPSWWNIPITRSIAIWQKEGDSWQEKIIKRRNEGKMELPPKTLANYTNWKEQNTRRLVLDKKRESQVMTLKNKDPKELKKSCLLLEVKMSEDPSELSIRSGSGKYYRLVYIEGVPPQTMAEIPEQLDIAAGRNDGIF